MIQIIPISKIKIFEDRHRQSFPEQDMLDLKESIFKGMNGLLQPLLLRPWTEADEFEYALVAGERRLRVIREANCEYVFGDDTIEPGHVPAVVKNFASDIDVEEAELFENIMRLDLTWIERAKAVARLDAFKRERDPNYSLGAIARMIDKSVDAGDYPSRTAYRELEQTKLVHAHLDDPEIQKAKSLSQATKVVAQRFQEANLQRLREIKIQERSEPAPAQELKLPDLSELATELEFPEAAEGTLYVGDVHEYLPKVESSSINVVLTDPPWGVDSDQFKDGGHFNAARHEYNDSAEYALELNKFLISELDRVCTPNAHVYIFVAFEHFHTIKDFFSDQWKVRRFPIIWSRGRLGKLSDGLPSGYSHVAEFILHATRGNKPYAKVLPDVLEVPPERDRQHAAQKPVALYEILLGMSALPGNKVLDPFAGTGTIFEAAYNLYLDPIGIEISEKYAAIADLRKG